MIQMTLIQTIAIWLLPVLFGITVHEVAHGWMASKLGDKTAKILGRLTLNPIKHIDLIGTVLLPLALLFFRSPFIFGWAKPVPISPKNFKHPRRDMVLVSLAGPLSNLLMAFIWAGVAKLGMILISSGLQWATPILLMGQAGILVNVILMVLNLIPIPPLDGGRVVSGLLPGRLAYHYDRIEPYGFIILIVLLFTNVLGLIITLPLNLILGFIFTIFGLK